MNNDLISRSALIENYEQFLARASLDPVIRAFMTTVCCTVKNAPAVDAEVVRHGRWDSEVVKCRDWKGIQRDYFQPHSCSVCHKPDPNQGKSNYCPNCGAKMRGKDDASK